MLFFRILMITMLIAIVTYTAVVGANHGWNLLPVFFGDIRAMTWPGQFNTDFMGFLLLSGLWIAWRHSFSVLGLVLAPLAILGGILFLSLYLLIVSYRVEGSFDQLLIGKTRAGG